MILLTDGDTNRQYHDHDQLMADFDKQHISVSTIRIGPDLENLRLLQDFAKVTGGTFYRVEDIRKLPLLLVHLTHQAIADKRHQQSHLEYAGESAISERHQPARDSADRALRGHRAQGRRRRAASASGAATAAAPLLAAWQYGLGRSAVFAADHRLDRVAQLGAMEPLRGILVAARELGDAPGRFRTVQPAGA